MVNAQDLKVRVGASLSKLCLVYGGNWFACPSMHVLALFQQKHFRPFFQAWDD
jgi:hypothetical protein